MVDQGECRALQQFGRTDFECNATPDKLNKLQQDIRQSEGDQQFRYMPELVNFAQCRSFKQRSHGTNDQWSDHKRRPEPYQL